MGIDETRLLKESGTMIPTKFPPTPLYCPHCERETPHQMQDLVGWCVDCWHPRDIGENEIRNENYDINKLLDIREKLDPPLIWEF
jgi:hypothetical protein